MTVRPNPSEEFRLLLVGAGHAHLAVLRSLGERAVAGLRAVLVVPEPAGLYSGMVPGMLAGRIAAEEARIDMAPLARRAGVELLVDRVLDLMPSRRCARTAGGSELRWEVCSLDLGSEVRLPAGLRDDLRVVPVKPFGDLVRRVDAFVALARANSIDPTSAVVGAGAAGIEVAFALRERLRSVDRSRVILVDEAACVLPSGSTAGRRLVARELSRAGIEVVAGRAPVELDGAALRAGGREVARPSLVVLATGAAAPPLLAATGLSLDEDGYLLVDRHLRSTSDPRVSGAGDCAVVEGARGVPRSGVQAVRQGPILAANLRRALGDEIGLRTWQARPGALALLSTGDGRAIALRGRLASSGRAWWWLKQRIDAGYVESHRVAPGDLGARTPVV